MSGGGLGDVYNIPFVSALLKIANGKIKVPTGTGFGVDFDPEWIAKHRPVGTEASLRQLGSNRESVLIRWTYDVKGPE